MDSGLGFDRVCIPLDLFRKLLGFGFAIIEVGCGRLRCRRNNCLGFAIGILCIQLSLCRSLRGFGFAVIEVVLGAQYCCCIRTPSCLRFRFRCAMRCSHLLNSDVIITARRLQSTNIFHNGIPLAAGPSSGVIDHELPNVKPAAFGAPVSSIAIFLGYGFARFQYGGFQLS